MTDRDPPGATRNPPARRVGDWICVDHDVVTPATDGPVPTCPHCGELVLRATRHRGVDYLVYVEPAPTHCDAPGRHDLGPDQAQVGWAACTCPGAPHRGHRTWTCRRCPSTIWIGTRR